jgi:hypothetical protein
VILAVRSKEPLHEPADGVPPPLDEQMNVIGHQAVSIKVERDFGLLVGELKKEFSIVVVRAENELAIVTTSDDVIKPALDFEPRSAHIFTSLTRRTPLVNCNLHA